MHLPAAEIPRAARLDSLTGLRWWAAFGVFAFHMNNLAPLPIFPVLRFGNYGVMFFFLLSGFVLTWAASPNVSATTFWWRRFSRIYPAFFVALILAIPVFYSFSPDPAQTWVKPVNIGILLLSVVLLQGWWRDPVVLFSGNPAGWTLTYESFFYALHPALNRVLRLLRLRGTLIAGFVVVLAAFAYRAAVLIWPDTFVTDLPWPVARLSEFALGMCAAQALRLGWLPRISPVALYLAGAAFIVWLVLTPHFLLGGATGFLAGGRVGAVIRLGVNEWMLILCLLLVIAVASRDVRGGRSTLRSKPLVKLGEWSYSFYLVHATVIYTVLAVVGRQPNSWKGLLWYPGMLAISIALAAALHYFVEKPCERFLRRRCARPGADPAPVVPSPV
jgi:peptidoglycan/LPS O-acetylase OafA/YrhL